MNRKWIPASRRASSADTPDRTERNRKATAETRGFWVSCGSLAVSCFTLWYLSVQTDATKGQLSEMEAEQRPWLAVLVGANEASIRSLGANSDTIYLSGDLKIRNIGRSPAVAVIASSHLFVEPYQIAGMQTGIPSGEEICKAAEKEGNRGGAIVFPIEQPTSVQISAAISRADIAKALDAKSRRLNMSANAGGLRRTSADELTRSADIYLRGCLTYSSVTPKGEHGTSFAFKVLWLGEQPTKSPEGKPVYEVRERFDLLGSTFSQLLAARAENEPLFAD